MAIHCHAGKDRTGLIILLINMLLELNYQVTNTESRLDEKNTQLNIMVGELLMLKEEQSETQQKNSILLKQVQELRAEKQTLLITLRTFNDELMNKLTIFCTKLFMALHTKDLGYQHKTMPSDLFYHYTYNQSSAIMLG